MAMWATLNNTIIFCPKCSSPDLNGELVVCGNNQMRQLSCIKCKYEWSQHKEEVKHAPTPAFANDSCPACSSKCGCFGTVLWDKVHVQLFVCTQCKHEWVRAELPKPLPGFEVEDFVSYNGEVCQIGIVGRPGHGKDDPYIFVRAVGKVRSGLISVWLRKEEVKAAKTPEITEENCTTLLPYCDPLMAFREIKRLKSELEKTTEDLQLTRTKWNAATHHEQTALDNLEEERKAHRETKKEFESLRAERPIPMNIWPISELDLQPLIPNSRFTIGDVKFLLANIPSGWKVFERGNVLWCYSPASERAFYWTKPSRGTTAADIEIMITKARADISMKAVSETLLARNEVYPDAWGPSTGSAKKIIINGATVETSLEQVTYADVVKLSGIGGQPLVDYGPPMNPTSIHAGSRAMKLYDGMRFCVRDRE